MGLSFVGFFWYNVLGIRGLTSRTGGLSMEQMYDLAVIGAGPGGYTAALTAAKLGMLSLIHILAAAARGFWGRSRMEEPGVYHRAICSRSSRFTASVRMSKRMECLVHSAPARSDAYRPHCR